MRVIHLVLDPSTVIYSEIKFVKWIKRSYRDFNFSLYVHGFCDPKEQNIRMGFFYHPPWLKDRFKVFRYEDLAVNNVNITGECRDSQDLIGLGALINGYLLMKDSQAIPRKNSLLPSQKCLAFY